MAEADPRSDGSETAERKTVVPPAAPIPEEPTVGTGSVVAIGCVIATMLVLVVGVLIVLWIR
ncbi:MAG: hypothetical protein M3464_19605 [Chloroflexota bacterium]|nr:hypothetical protein [Chloroflexota bacterium]